MYTGADHGSGIATVNIGDLRVRLYEGDGPPVVVVHGGPAAVGNAGPIARGLAPVCRVYEPWQRGSGSVPLTVEQHVEDLDAVVQAACSYGTPVLIGESWGAMLALAYAAAFPHRDCPLVLVGCGTFDEASRRCMQETIAARLTPDMQQALADIRNETADSPDRLMRQYDIIRCVYDADPIEAGTDPRDRILPFDEVAHRQTWEDMLACQAEGLYPEAFQAIRSPVLMIHGDYDPHPGPQTAQVLSRWIPQLKYCELAHCGHSPWNERFAREAFFRILREWVRVSA
jgi:pimeloyl-ACP methyl ester carboxylesterase